ncbi:MAG: hypothetical protein ABSF91_15705 [Bacteroidota bacterium]|jgi:hypothetical protein
MSPHILMIFLDGVGIGKKDPVHNPFFKVEMKALARLLGGKMPHLRDAHITTPAASVVPLNATLGVPGLPQSGTGQTALFTGFNAPRFVGKHFGPYPYSTLKPVIAERSIFRRLLSLGKKPFYANAFPRQFFEYIGSSAKKSRVPVCTMSWLSSGFELNDAAALSKGRAVSSDITNRRWPSLGYPEMPVLTPGEAGRRLTGFVRKFDFVLFEYYLTDKAGHAQSMQHAAEVLSELDGLLEGVLSAFDDSSMLLIVTSDHGNIEDLSTKSHTRNPVPLLAAGSLHRELTSNAENLTHVVPAIINMMN